MLRPDPTEYRGYRVTGARLTEPVADEEIGYHSSQRELPLAYAYHALDIAHLVMLIEEGFVPRGEGAQMLRALREMDSRGLEATYLEVQGGMHSGEVYLVRRFGEELGGKLELGRASGEMVQVAWRMRERDMLVRLMEALTGLRQTLQDLSEVHLDTVMPGYTHGQQAQLITLAHMLLAWDGALGRSFERASEAFHRVNWSAAGTGNMAGCDFPLNRHRVAELLGFQGPVDNTYDAIQHNDHALECLSVLAILGGFLSRWAQDLYFYLGQEVRMLEIPDRFCGTSALMAQKKNPMLIENLQGASALSTSALVTALMVEKTPSGGAIAERLYFMEALWKGFEDSLKYLDWMKLLLPQCRWKLERMRELAEGYWAQASTLAGTLVRERSLAWRTAHEIAATVVRLSLERSIPPLETTGELVDEAAVLYTGRPVGLLPGALATSLDPSTVVGRHSLYGGPAPSRMEGLLKERRVDLLRERQAVASYKTGLADARERLETAVDALLS